MFVVKKNALIVATLMQFVLIILFLDILLI